jgi:hypothetical protein
MPLQIQRTMWNSAGALKANGPAPVLLAGAWFEEDPNKNAGPFPFPFSLIEDPNLPPGAGVDADAEGAPLLNVNAGVLVEAPAGAGAGAPNEGAVDGAPPYMAVPPKEGTGVRAGAPPPAPSSSPQTPRFFLRLPLSPDPSSGAPIANGMPHATMHNSHHHHLHPLEEDEETEHANLNMCSAIHFGV